MKKKDLKLATTIGAIYGLILLSLVLIISKPIGSLFYSLDWLIFNFFRVNSLLVPIMKIITFFGNGWVLVFLAATASLIIYKRDKLYSKLLFITTILTQIIVGILKEIFKRARPPIGYVTETRYSFPSGHTTTSIVFYVLVSLFIISNCKSKTKYLFSSLLIILAFLISLSRLVLNVHWFSDIVLGFLLSISIILIVLSIYHKFNKKS